MLGIIPCDLYIDYVILSSLDMHKINALTYIFDR